MEAFQTANFVDILQQRRAESSHFMWISRKLDTQGAFKQTVKPTPKWHKREVVNSPKIQAIIRQISEEEKVPIEKLEKQVWAILDEIGFNKRLIVIRWLGLVLTKICLQVCTKINVNEAAVLKLKQCMGSTPVIFVPSHRSYADFILMSYMCFYYDIEIPAIAAGMDFHGMWGMGSILRDTGAFFMRRSYNDDSLYWDTFKQYIKQIITKGDLPVEFFLEGTRSRTGKSLKPKYGLLSMVLKPFFMSEVPDILFVPINISYDRILEEKLFAFELLGVPKPKESTSQFFKSLSIIKEQFGKIYMNFAEPVSAKEFFSCSVDRSVHAIKPSFMQEVTTQEKAAVASFASALVHMQQQQSTITAFNLLALSLTTNIVTGKETLLNEVVERVTGLKSIVEVFGGCTDVTNARQDITDAVSVHHGLIEIVNGRVKLVKNAIALNTLDLSKMKGHSLSQETMAFVVPYIMLQIYVNPILHFLVSPAIILLVLKFLQSLNKDNLLQEFCFLRSIFSHEFVTVDDRNRLDFTETLERLQTLGCVNLTGGEYFLSKNVEAVFIHLLKPFLYAYYVVCKLLCESSNHHNENTVVVNAQAQLESVVNNHGEFVHPYCLSLDVISNCLAVLVSLGILEKKRANEEVICYVKKSDLHSTIIKLERYIDPSLKEYIGSLQPSIHLDAKL